MRGFSLSRPLSRILRETGPIWLNHAGLASSALPSAAVESRPRDAPVMHRPVGVVANGDVAFACAAGLPPSGTCEHSLSWKLLQLAGAVALAPNRLAGVPGVRLRRPV
jgi:hypothetical protein